jgi:hypothetical protein
MVTFTSGTYTTTSSEANIFSDVVDTKVHGCLLFLHNMTSTETFVFKIYLYDPTGTPAFRLFDTITKTGVQSTPAYYVPFIPSRQYRISVQRTAGSDRVIDYDLVKY